MLDVTKRTVAIAIQILLFWLANWIGSFRRPFQIRHEAPFLNDRILWDGILLMFAAYAMVLLCRAFYKRLPKGVIESTIALALAVLIGYWSGFDSPAPFGF